ncbi:unnamed protein product [Prunus armeniaca]|uniref:Uncharacterized protein n=1 Tax=Prunus armeniaca TaxID=36596 RepID=A0A6J5WZ56_PRUAR|nr:unnamed protein product [Prunus armeniaca]
MFFATFVSSNSIILKATSQGRDKLTASLTYFSALNETKEILKVAQEVMVCDKVKFSLDKSDASPTIFRPWAPAIYQEVVLRHPVTRNGSLQTWAKKPGKATIKVLSIFYPFNYDEVVVEVSVPASMVILLNFPVETVVGTHLQAAVTMKASNGA